MDEDSDEIINQSYAFLSDFEENKTSSKSLKERVAFFEISPWSDRQKTSNNNNPKSVNRGNPRTQPKPGGSSLLKATQSFLSPENPYTDGRTAKTTPSSTMNQGAVLSSPKRLVSQYYDHNFENTNRHSPQPKLIENSYVSKFQRSETNISRAKSSGNVYVDSTNKLDIVQSPSSMKSEFSNRWKTPIEPRHKISESSQKSQNDIISPRDGKDIIPSGHIARAKSFYEPIISHSKSPQPKLPPMKEKNFRETLNEILKHRVESQRSSVSSSVDVNPSHIEDIDIPESEGQDKYKTIKTLSKAAMKNRLEVILTKGPPQRPSFRGRLDFDPKRQEAISALRKIENEALASKKQDDFNDQLNFQDDVDGGNIMNRQRMLMKDVNATIKLKNRFSSYN